MIHHQVKNEMHKLVFITADVGNVHVVGRRTDIFLLGRLMNIRVETTNVRGTDEFLSSEDLTLMT